MTVSDDILAEYVAPTRLRALGGAYLATNSMGIIPRSAIDAERASLELQATEGLEVWDGGAWMGVLDRHAAVISRYVGVRPDQVCPITNITDGLWRVFSSLKFTPSRNVILQTNMEFTTQEYAAYGFEQLGARVEVVRSDARHHRVETDRLIDAIRTHRPVVLNLSHVTFESSYRHDVEAIAAACREVDTVFCLDAAQTGFVLPLNLEKLGADVLLLQQHKWGCAGTGCAALVASERFLSRSPALIGWLSHAETFRFEKGPARLPHSAWRFVGGTPEVPAKARGAAAAEIIIDRLGINTVYAHNQRLVDILLDGLDEIGFPGIRHERRGAFVAIQCESAQHAHAIEQGLRRRHIVIDSRGDRLRVGATFYNTEDDVRRLIDALKTLRGGE
jgi:kynureninase